MISDFRRPAPPPRRGRRGIVCYVIRRDFVPTRPGINDACLDNSRFAIGIASVAVAVRSVHLRPFAFPFRRFGSALRRSWSFRVRVTSHSHSTNQDFPSLYNLVQLNSIHHLLHAAHSSFRIFSRLCQKTWSCPLPYLALAATRPRTLRGPSPRWESLGPCPAGCEKTKISPSSPPSLAFSAARKALHRLTCSA